MRSTLGIAVLAAALALPAAAATDDFDDTTIRIGGAVEVSEPTNGTLAAVGGKVSVDAPVQGSLRAAGGKVDVNAPVAGDASIAAGNVVVKGPIAGNLHAAGGHVTIDTSVGGDASVGAGSLTLGPNARITGKLKFRGGELKQDDAATITGGIVHNRGHEARTRTHVHRHGDDRPLINDVAWTLGLAVLAALLAGALPGPTQQLTAELRARPWHAPLLGFLALTAIPLAAILLMITIIGIPIALLTIALYVAVLVVGYVWLAVVLGGLLLERFKPETAAVVAWRVGAAALTVIVIALLVRVPFLGGFIKFAALIVGLGMIVGALWRRVEMREARSS